MFVLWKMISTIKKKKNAFCFKTVEVVAKKGGGGERFKHNNKINEKELLVENKLN